MDLFEAARDNQVDLIELLIEKGHDINTRVFFSDLSLSLCAASNVPFLLSMFFFDFRDGSPLGSAVGLS
jgi:hypothetical protein